MPIESELKKLETPQITEEMPGAEAHDVARDDSQEMESKVQQEKDEKELLKEIEQKISNLEIGSHGMSTLMYQILEYGIDSKDGSEAFNSLKSIFKHGVWSWRKQRLDIEGGRGRLTETVWAGFGDRHTQNSSSSASREVFKAMFEYLKEKGATEINANEIDYDEMINDVNFLNILKQFDHSGQIRGSVLDILESPRMKVIFKYVKKDTQGKITDLMNKPWLHFGLNLISVWSPKEVLKKYKEKGEIPGVDKLTILFKLPKKIHVHPMPKRPWHEENEESPEIGISNKISPKEFVAIALDHKIDIEKIPKEVLDAIPKNLPIVTSDLKKVIRMPETK